MNSSLPLFGDKQLLSFLCLRTRKTSSLGVHRVLYLFRARELTANNINEPLIGYLEGQLARMQLDS